MIIRLNGEPQELCDGITIETLVQQQSKADSPQGIAVAQNGQVVRRAQWACTPVSPNDDIEILQAVAGG